MIRLDLPLIGPAATTLATLKQLPARHNRFAVLLHGDPGVAKSHLLDMLALELTGSKFAIEQANGQSVSVDLVRQWQTRSASGNLFSRWTVKRIDELDSASPAACNQLLTWLDYLPAYTVVLATTNHYSDLRAASKGRLETRFKTFRVDAPTIGEAVPYLCQHFGLPARAAEAIARGAVPDGQFDGVNMRAAVEDAEGLLSERAAMAA